eukprot:8695247-Alexandrium_andersonii.AAC.1
MSGMDCQVQHPRVALAEWPLRAISSWRGDLIQRAITGCPCDGPICPPVAWLDGALSSYRGCLNLGATAGSTKS